MNSHPKEILSQELDRETVGILTISCGPSEKYTIYVLDQANASQGYLETFTNNRDFPLEIFSESMPSAYRLNLGETAPPNELVYFVEEEKELLLFRYVRYTGGEQDNVFEWRLPRAVTCEQRLDLLGIQLGRLLTLTKNPVFSRITSSVRPLLSRPESTSSEPVRQMPQMPMPACYIDYVPHKTASDSDSDESDAEEL